MAFFIINSATFDGFTEDTSYSISKDGNLRDYPINTFVLDLDPNNEKLITLNTNFGRQVIYSIDLNEDTVNINGVSFDISNTAQEIREELHPFFFRNTTGGGGGPVEPTHIYENPIFVDSTGDDLTGVVGDFNKPFLTIEGALNAGSSGNTIVLMPGTYNNVSNLVKDNISIVSPFGQSIINTIDSTFAQDLGIQTKWSISGDIVINAISSVTEGINFTNPLSVIDFEINEINNVRFHILEGDNHNVSIKKGNEFFFRIQNTTNVKVYFGNFTNFVWSDFGNNIDFEFTGDSISDPENLIQPQNSDNALSIGLFKNTHFFSGRNVFLHRSWPRYTFDNCFLETDQSSGAGNVVFCSRQANQQIAKFNNCKFKNSGNIDPFCFYYTTGSDHPLTFTGTNLVETSNGITEFVGYQSGTSEIKIYGTFISKTNSSINLSVVSDEGTILIDSTLVI